MELGVEVRQNVSVKSEWEQAVCAKLAQTRKVKLYLAIRAARHMPMGGKHLGGTWVKPASK